MRWFLITFMACFVSCGACGPQAALLPTSNDKDDDDDVVMTNTTNDTNNNTTTEPEVPACGTGALIGHACEVTGQPLARAMVTVKGTDCATGEAFEMSVETNNYGTFQFQDVPSGEQEILVASGFFSASRMVEIIPNSSVDITADKLCVESDANIAVIEGIYDHVEGILEASNLPYEIVGSDAADTATIAFLTHVEAMSEYDVVFINCGSLYDAIRSSDSTGMLLPRIAETMREYVEGGGSIYTSDWAAPFVEEAFPDMIDWYGDDTSTSSYRTGAAPQSITASINTPALQSLLGAEQTIIDFELPGWAVISSVGPNAVAHLQGETIVCGEDIPACKEPGAPLLATYTAPSGGTVMFTSFHNDRQQGHLNEDMELILRFLVFRL